MAAFVIFEADLVDGLLGTRWFFGLIGIALVEVAVRKVVFPKEIDVLQHRAIIESVASSVASEARPSGVERLSSACGIDMLVRQGIAVLKAIWNSNGMQVTNVAVCVGCLHIVDLTEDNIGCFRRCGRGLIGPRARLSTVMRAWTRLRAAWSLWQ